MREAIFWIMVVILFGVAMGEFGFIYGKWEKFDHDGRLARHETQIQILKSDMKMVKEKVRIP